MSLAENADQKPTLLSSAHCTTSSPLCSSSDINPSEPRGEFSDDTSFLVDYIGYDGIDWNRLAGHSISRRRKRPRTGWVWEHGFDIETPILAMQGVGGPYSVLAPLKAPVSAPFTDGNRSFLSAGNAFRARTHP
ncbi:hypothetical protein BGZ63DRAFT_429621 [Mariannaea sp. PMI_226]|nr:hypothetical protein BGZ63DRAFT_429621 [Mariannaea sp. PMI_226]